MDGVSQGGLPGAAPEPPERVDGRRQRRVRTRQAILDSYLALLQERPVIPTVEQVARRALLSERAVFAHFADRESLAVAAFDHVLSQRRNTPADDVLGADRQSRIRFQVEIRARACEKWLPLWKVVVVALFKTPEIARRIELVRTILRSRLETIYQPELSTLSPSDRAATLAVLEIVTNFETWGRLREHSKLSYEEACAASMKMVDRVLPPTP